MAPRVPHKLMGMARAAMRATRMGRSKMMTITTAMMAIKNSWLRLVIRSLTTPGWLHDQVDLGIGGKQHLEALKDRIQLLTQFDNVFPLLHLDGEEQARVAVVTHHERRVLVAALHVGEIFDV